METLSTMGGLVPLWILCAPLLLAVMSLSTSPKPRRRDDERDTRAAHTQAYPQPVTGLGAQRF
jgi:hypothetical protein